MLRYFQKKGQSSSPSNNFEATNVTKESTPGDNEQRKHMRVDINDLPADPIERPSIDFYHVNQRDEIRRAYLQKGSCQTRKHSFPTRDFGRKPRRFIASWFDEHKYWLEYSIKADAVFCLCCYLFKSEIKNQGGSDQFTKSGFKAWNRKEGLNDHKAGVPHKMAIQKCQNLMNQKQSIGTLFSNQTTQEKKAYVIRLNAAINVVRFMLREGLPFRGHDETEDSPNKGNFHELLEWLADRCDAVTRDAIKKAPLNCQMRSPSIQKEMVHSCAKVTVQVILEELGDEFFSILVDESRDVSCKEQMALVLRFVNNKGVVVERFLGIKKVGETSASSLKKTIYAMMSDMNLSHTRIRGQGYDGASNMSGAFNGLKTLIMNDTKSAYFVHCFAHRLQLALVFVAKTHTKVNDFFDAVSKLLNIIGASYKRRDKLRDKQATKVVASLAAGELESGKGQNQEVGIKRPCDTRWGSHFASLLNIRTIYSSICEVLEDLKVENIDQDYKAEALRVLRSLKSFNFVICLHLMVDFLGVTNRLNKVLQRKDQDIINAMNQVRLSKEKLQELRNEGWEPLLNKVTSFCDKHDVEIRDMSDPYYDGISRRRSSHVNNLHHYQVNVFYAVIDMQLQELNYRFNEVSTRLLLSMACLCPSESFKAFNLEKLMEMATFYPEEFPTKNDLQLLQLELQDYIKDVRADENFNHLKSLGDLSQMMVETKRHIIYPNVYFLLKLALILPVATSTMERAFSAMKLIKSDLRNKMSDDFMNDSLVSYIEKDVLDGISNEDLMKQFQSQKPRRVVL